MAKNFVDIKGLGEVEALLRDLDGEAPRALTRAINATLSNVKTQAAKKIGAMIANTPDKYRDAEATKAGDIKKKIEDEKANYSRLSGRLKFSKSRFSLRLFSPRQFDKGVVATVHKGVKTPYPHAFISKKPSHLGNVFWREGPSRTPITKLTGPSIGDILEYHNILYPVMDLGGDRFRTNLDKEIESIFRRHKAGLL